MSPILPTDYAGQENLLSKGSITGLLVTTKGTVQLPLIGSVKVAGLTENQASKFLIKKYKKYIRTPYVTIKIANQRIIVIGEVNKPGVIPIVNGTMSVIEAIARSDYFKPTASRSDIMIIRGDLRHPKIRKIDLTDGKSVIRASMLLQPNDILYVEAKTIHRYNYVFKETLPFFQAISTILNPFVLIKTAVGN